MKFYGTMICPDTVYADKVLRKNGVDVEYIDITANTANLKDFLKLRDSKDEFASKREKGKIGVPAFLLDDGSITFDVYDLEGVTEHVEEEKESNLEMCQL